MGLLVKVQVTFFSLSRLSDIENTSFKIRERIKESRFAIVQNDIQKKFLKNGLRLIRLIKKNDKQVTTTITTKTMPVILLNSFACHSNGILPFQRTGGITQTNVPEVLQIP